MLGLQRLFADVDGKFYPCERVNETSEIMQIGDVDAGINVSKVKELLNVGKITEDSCKNVGHLDSVLPVLFMQKMEINYQLKRGLADAVRLKIVLRQI